MGGLVLLGCGGVDAPTHEAFEAIDEAGLHAHTEILSSDAFEGRAPSTEGERRTVDYLISTFESLGLEPGAGDEFTQEVPLVSITADPDQALSIRGRSGDLDLEYGEGYIAWTKRVIASGRDPTHPELLDFLAVRFVEQGWSIKSIVRELALSRTYRQSSDYRDDAFQRDPENQWLWRASKRRMDAEVIRDAALSVAGRLDLRRPSASLVAEIGNRPVSIIGFDRRVTKDLDGSQHRSIYLPVIRDRLPDAIELFDGAEPSLVTGKRQTTNVPLQGLYLMNGPFITKQSEALAKRVTAATESTRARVNQLFELCFARPPDRNELKIAVDYLGKSDSDRRWALYCQALLCTAEFRNLD